MAVSPTPEQWEYIHYNQTEWSENTTIIHGTASSRIFTFDEWMLILSLVIALVGLVGNGLVLWLLGFRIKRNPYSVYILNLAGADALFLCFHFVFYVLYFLEHFYHYGIIETYVFTYMFYIVGISLLAAISTERCLSVLFPIWYRCHRPKHTSTMVCTVLWAVDTLVWGTGFVICYTVNNGDFCMYFIIITFIWFFLFIPLMCVSSLTLLLRVQCSSQHRQPPRLYLLVMVNVLIFLFCGLPLGVVCFLWLLHKPTLPLWLLQLLTCVNSSANPFIYFFLGKLRHNRRRETLRVILQRALGDDEEVGSGERNTLHTNSVEISC